jgi:DNA-binding PadR family transcriptional regulator
MSIKHALLGLIAEEPMHGYRLKEVFDERVGPLWGLTTAQIYQALNTLERRGLLTSRGERVGNRPERRIYAVTDAGSRELGRWLDGPASEWLRPYRADALLRLLFLRRGDVPRFAAAIDRCEEELVHLQRRVSRRPQRLRAADARLDVAALFLAGTTAHVFADLATLRRCRQALLKWRDARAAAAGAMNAGARVRGTAGVAR